MINLYANETGLLFINCIDFLKNFLPRFLQDGGAVWQPDGFASQEHLLNALNVVMGPRRAGGDGPQGGLGVLAEESRDGAGRGLSVEHRCRDRPAVKSDIRDVVSEIMIVY